MSLLRRSFERVLSSRRSFELFQRLGIHVTPNHFYSPVPDTRELDRGPGFRDEECVPHEYFVRNGAFGLISAAVLHSMRLIAVEPYPGEVLRRGVPGLTRLIAEKAQDVGRDLFTGLQAGDVLFLNLDVLPRLAKGVVVHIHDIFLPRHYPRRWVVDGRRFWAGQYLMQHKHPGALREVFPLPDGLSAEEGYASSSFWMRRIG